MITSFSWKLSIHRKESIIFPRNYFRKPITHLHKMLGWFSKLFWEMEQKNGISFSWPNKCQTLNFTGIKRLLAKDSFFSLSPARNGLSPKKVVGKQISFLVMGMNTRIGRLAACILAGKKYSRKYSCRKMQLGCRLILLRILNGV